MTAWILKAAHTAREGFFMGLWQLAWLEIEGAEEKEDASSEA
jgi:hypothetical protein